MQNTTTIAPFSAVSYKGNAPVNGQLAGNKELAVTVGGIFSIGSDNDSFEGLPFGRVVSIAPADPQLFLIGAPTSSVVAGVGVFDPAIAQNQPALSNSYLKQTPATVLREGVFQLSTWTKDAASAVDPIRGAVVIFSKTTGQIEFQPAGTSSAPTGYALLSAVVLDVEDGGSVGPTSGTSVVTLKINAAA